MGTFGDGQAKVFYILRKLRIVKVGSSCVIYWEWLSHQHFLHRAASCPAVLVTWNPPVSHSGSLVLGMFFNFCVMAEPGLVPNLSAQQVWHVPRLPSVLTHCQRQGLLLLPARRFPQVDVRRHALLFSPRPASSWLWMWEPRTCLLRCLTCVERCSARFGKKLILLRGQRPCWKNC